MFGIGMTELLLILLIILIIFGVGKLPDTGSALGKTIRNFKRSTREFDERNDKKGSQKISGDEMD